RDGKVRSNASTMGIRNGKESEQFQGSRSSRGANDLERCTAVSPKVECEAGWLPLSITGGGGMGVRCACRDDDNVRRTVGSDGVVWKQFRTCGPGRGRSLACR